ncbi:hypothetical protein [Actinoplanes subglobosus]|uniref:Uncharacterized protein n=1 Tax=Actinoplanes subglobosus TaxID=1547892 RepID=A0ABV8JBE5_9ACTN
MTGILLLIGGTVLVLIIVIVIAATVLVRRSRANHSPDRDELLRRARQASGKINRENERNRRGSLRGGGLGGDSTPMD